MMTTQTIPVPFVPSAEAADRLSKSEKRVVALVAQGYSLKEAASILHRSWRTIDNHLGNVSRAIGTRDRAALCRFAMRAGLIEP